MARRRSYPGGKWYERPNSAYARSAGWPTRYYDRKIGGSQVTSLAGLNTTSDDFSKKDGESPYLWNVRLAGTKEAKKRAQSMSRMGQEFMCLPPNAEVTLPANEATTKIAISETESIRWKVDTTGKLTAVGLRFAFDEDYSETNAHFVLILRDANLKEICRAYKKLSDLDTDDTVWFRFIKSTQGEAWLEATLVDDFDDFGTAMHYTAYMLASGHANHKVSYHELPNLDEALREKAYEWELSPHVPVTAMKQVEIETFPVWLQQGFFNAGGSRYVTVGVKDSEGIKVYKVRYADVDPDTGAYKELDELSMELLIPAGKISSKASQVRATQAGNRLLFVDGYSPLQEVNLDDWTVANAVPDMNAVDTPTFTPLMYYYKNSIIVMNGHFQRAKEDFEAGENYDQENWEQLDDGSSITAWPGASLIYFHNNRVFLSGFRHETVGETSPKAEPNLVIMSSIDSVTARYTMFNRSLEFFYVPDRAPSMSSSAPVTAFSSIGDYLLVFTSDGLYVEQVQSAVEFAGIAQTTPEGSQYGVIKQEHVARGRNNVYFLNPTQGVMRTAGATAEVMSGPIESILMSFDEGPAEEVQRRYEKMYLAMTGDVLRLYYDPADDGNMECLVDYLTYRQHKSYWYRDNNVPVAYTMVDNGSDNIFAVHSQYPALMKVDSSYKDFDCAILYEYYTKYIGTPGRLDHVIVRRVHISTLQTYQSSVFVGLDYDHNNKPIVWRRFITPTEPGSFEPEDIFGDDGESGATNLDIRILTDDTRFVQIRLKQYCYDFQAEILQVGFEYSNRTVL